MTPLKLAACCICAYLLGSFSPSIVVTRIVKKADIRTLGSGNAGMSNTLRVLGPGPASVVIFFDILKSVLACFIGLRLSGHTGLLASGVCLILGHAFPVFFGFRGGKAVVCSSVLLGFINIYAAAAAVFLAVAVILIAKKVSPGSLLGELSAPFILLLLKAPLWDILYFSCIVLFVMFLHRGNIKRLISGTENGITTISEGKDK